MPDLRRSFTQLTLQWAQALVGAVRLEPRAEAGKWAGVVAVEGELSHHALAHWASMGLGRGFGWRSFCTCGQQTQCAHAAAVLLAVLAAGARDDNAVRESVLGWVQALRAQHAPAAADAVRPAPVRAPECLYYSVRPERSGMLRLRMYKSRLNREGVPTGRAQRWVNVEDALLNPPRFVNAADLAVLRTWCAHSPGRVESWSELGHVTREAAPVLLPLLLATGRVGLEAWLSEPDDAVHQLSMLRAGPARSAALVWQTHAGGQQSAALTVEQQGTLVAGCEPAWYFDAQSGEAGLLEAEHLDASMLSGLLRLPSLSVAEAAVVAATLEQAAPAVARPGAPQMQRLQVPLVPVLRLSTMAVHPAAWAGASLRGYKEPHIFGTAPPRPMSHARLFWRYGELEFDAHAGDAAVREHFRGADGQWIELQRDRAAEQACKTAFAAAGFKPAPPPESMRAGRPPQEGAFILENEAAWPPFMAQSVQAWQAQGWQVKWDRHFDHGRYRADALHGSVHPASATGEAGPEPAGWSLELGVEVQGRRLSLAPMLADLLKREPRWFDAAQVNAMPDGELVTLISDEGWRIDVEAGRLKPIVRTLIDLFDSVGGDGRLQLSRWDALRLVDLQRHPHWAFNAGEAAQALAQRLRGGQGVQPVEPPAGLGIALRPYQCSGLAWLQYLRQNDLAGILADDMGLGKTAQTLAHVLAEKQAGRLDRPALVVLPTSLVFNWQAEAARIAPALRVLVLHGKERAERFDAIPGHDLILTTYPLVWRDIDSLSQHDYHLLVLDEAQAVKNAAGRSAEAVRKLRARHRLCITGTPLENNLGELWAQFDFLLPGFLGDARDFTRRWRGPIEKQGHSLRAQALAARIRPFVLRRRKEDVAKELPAKTEVVRRVALEGAQRDLYETVRAAMDEQVRREIAAKGLARSHILVLDALLKLRQVCCDPHLLKRRTLPKGVERAKLDALADMLRELIDEGRRILVFSQFAEMLALIAKRLEEERIQHVTLTGRTQDRQGVVAQFQTGSVPVFLISLKAGGVGLNLTAADTVIHYDPWWNPAAEAQATDRAHRIGQHKPVFVYKLVAAGSIEERILELQQRKAQLADAVLGRDAAKAEKFSQADINALLAPLEALTPAR